MKKSLRKLILCSFAVIATASLTAGVLSTNIAMMKTEADTTTTYTGNTFEMVNGASVRLTNDEAVGGNGLRFTAEMSAAYYEATRYLNDVSYGMFIMPQEYVSLHGELTEENVEAGGTYNWAVSDTENEYADEAKTKIINVKYATLEQDEGIADAYYIRGSILGILDENLEREFIGRAYVRYKVGDAYEYDMAEWADDDIENNTRTIYKVAEAALADEESGLTDSEDAFLQREYIDVADSLYQEISTVEEFTAMEADGKYQLASDIDFGGATYTSTVLTAGEFSGRLKGNGHTLSNFTLSGTDLSVFGELSGSVENLNIQDVTVAAGSTQSAVVAHALLDGNIQGVNVSVNYEATGSNNAGMVTWLLKGSVSDSTITMDSVHDRGDWDGLVLIGRNSYASYNGVVYGAEYHNGCPTLDNVTAYIMANVDLWTLYNTSDWWEIEPTAINSAVKLLSHTVTVYAKDMTVEGVLTANNGENVTFTVTANDGYTLSADNATLVSSDGNIYTFTVDSITSDVEVTIKATDPNAAYETVISCDSPENLFFNATATNGTSTIASGTGMYVEAESPSELVKAYKLYATSGWYQFKELDLTKYTELKFWVNGDGTSWVQVLHGTGDYGQICLCPTAWIEVSFEKQSDGTWTMYQDGTQKVTGITDFTNLSISLGGNHYITDLIGIVDPNAMVVVSDSVFSESGMMNTETVAEGSSKSTVITKGWSATPNITFNAIEEDKYTQLMFYILGVNAGEWFQVRMDGGTDDLVAFDGDNSTFHEIKFVKEGDGTWCVYYDDALKGNGIASVSDMDIYMYGTYYVSELFGIVDPDYTPPAEPTYITVVECNSPENLFFNTTATNGTSTIASGTGMYVEAESPSELVKAYKLYATSGWYQFKELDLTKYTELKFWVNGDGTSWVQVLHGTGDYGQICLCPTAWIEVSFEKQSDGTWTMYQDGTQKVTGITDFTNLSISLGGNHYITDLIGIDPNYVVPEEPECKVTVKADDMTVSGILATETVGSDLTFTVTANDGYTLSADNATLVSVDGNVYTFTVENISSAVTVTITATENVVEETPAEPTYAVVVECNSAENLFFNTTAANNSTVQSHESYTTDIPDASVNAYHIYAGSGWYQFKSVDLTKYTELKFWVNGDGENWVQVLHGTGDFGQICLQPTAWIEVSFVKQSDDTWTMCQDGTAKTTGIADFTNLSISFGGYHYITDLIGISPDYKAPTIADDVEKTSVTVYTCDTPANLFFNATATAGDSTIGSMTEYTEDLPAEGVKAYGFAGGYRWYQFKDIDLAQYSELKFWVNSSDNSYVQVLHGEGEFGQICTALTAWIEVSFKKQADGTWTMYQDGTEKATGIVSLTDMTINFGNAHYITELIGIPEDMLVSGGTTEYTLVYDINDSNNVALAAEEFTLFMKEATGAEFKTLKGLKANDIVSEDKYIVFGSMAEELLGSDWLNGLTTDTGYIMAKRGNVILLYGKTSYGTLNATYALMKKYIGLEFFTTDTYVINSTNNVSVSDWTDVTFNPDIDYLWNADGALTANNDQTKDNKLNARLGYTYSYQASAADWHNFTALISKDKYGAHTDWFISGNGYETLNLANATARSQIALAVARELAMKIEEDQEETIFYGFSGPDATVTEYTTDDYLCLMNEIAQILDTKYSFDREIKLLMLAYNNTLTAPTSTAMYKGEDVKLGVMFAPIQANQYASIEDSTYVNYETNETNSAMAAEFNKWKALGAEMYYWKYSLDIQTNFMPFDSISNMRATYQFAAENGVTVMNDQGQYYQAVGTDWSDLKIYLKAQLAKDVDADVDALITKFCENVYGEGAAYMEALIEAEMSWYKTLADDRATLDGVTYAGYVRGSGWLLAAADGEYPELYWDDEKSGGVLGLGAEYTNDMISGWYSNIESALSVVTDTDTRNAIMLEGLTIRYLSLKVYGEGLTVTTTSGTSVTDSYTQLLTDAQALGVTYFGESNPLDSADFN